MIRSLLKWWRAIREAPRDIERLQTLVAFLDRRVETLENERIPAPAEAAPAEQKAARAPYMSITQRRRLMEQKDAELAERLRAGAMLNADR